MNKGVMALISIVESEKGKKLIETLKDKNIKINYQCTGIGTAPTEMMDIFGLGTNAKDVVISLGSQDAVKEMMSHFGDNFTSYSKYGGLMIVLSTSAISRLAFEFLNHNVEEFKGDEPMKNEHHHNLIMISTTQGYIDDVMACARQAGATGGTVIRGRLAESESLKELTGMEISEERDILLILAPSNVSDKIMEEVNREFGLRTKAHSIICAVPVDKAYKI